MDTRCSRGAQTPYHDIRTTKQTTTKTREVPGSSYSTIRSPVSRSPSPQQLRPPTEDHGWPSTDSCTRPTIWSDDNTATTSSSTSIRPEVEEPPPPINRSIYPLQTRPGWRVTVTPYNNLWPSQFETIKSHLVDLFTTSDPPAKYQTIEHIGSTSIPGLAAKPNIDVLVTFSTRSALEAGIEALNWEITTKPPFTRYTRIANGGGIQGRESFKLFVPEWSSHAYSTPERSVYLVEESNANPAGRVLTRCYRSVKETLCDPVNKDLLYEYAAVKIELAKQVFEDSVTYASLKNDVIRKILKRARWTDGEVDEKEGLNELSSDEDEPAY